MSAASSNEGTSASQVVNVIRPNILCMISIQPGGRAFRSNRMRDKPEDTVRFFSQNHGFRMRSRVGRRSRVHAFCPRTPAHPVPDFGAGHGWPERLKRANMTLEATFLLSRSATSNEASCGLYREGVI